MTRKRKVYKPQDALNVRIRNDAVASAINDQENASGFINDAIEFYIQHGSSDDSSKLSDGMITELSNLFENIIEKVLSRHAIHHSGLGNQSGEDLEAKQKEEDDKQEIQSALDMLADY